MNKRMAKVMSCIVHTTNRTRWINCANAKCTKSATNKRQIKNDNAYITFRCQRRCVYAVSVLARDIITTHNSFTIKFIDKQRGGQRFAISKSNVIKTMAVCYFHICLFSAAAAAAAILCGQSLSIRSCFEESELNDTRWGLRNHVLFGFNGLIIAPNSNTFQLQIHYRNWSTDRIIRTIDMCILFTEVDNFLFTLWLQFKSVLTPLDKA